MAYSINLDNFAKRNGFNASQTAALKMMENHPVVCLAGPAGCGKTHVAISYSALCVKTGNAEKIVYIRPPAETGRFKMGYLPGDANEKMAPYVAAMSEIAKKLGISPEVIEVIPPCFVQGRTFDNSIVVVDECQIFDLDEFQDIVTRLGKTSKMILCGDPAQDRKRLGEFKLFLKCVEQLTSVDVQYFTFEDNMRHPVIVEILNACEVAVSERSSGRC